MQKSSFQQFLALLAALFLGQASAPADAEESLTLTAIHKTKAVDVLQHPRLSAAALEAHGTLLPDGHVAVRTDGDIREAWLSRPTKRYGHGVLGDVIEAGAVTARLATGALVSFVLPPDSVFEDITPRLGDLDGDGRTEIILVRSYLRHGASLAVFGIKSRRLRLLAQTPAIGMANRWLNPSILADLDGSGRLTIGLVRTPHIGGDLQLWRYENGSLEMLRRASGFSNHSIGSRALGLSAVLNKGDQKRILIPDATQANLLLLDAETLKPIKSVPLPARPTGNFIVQPYDEGHQSVLLALEDGWVYQLEDKSGELID